MVIICLLLVHDIGIGLKLLVRNNLKCLITAMNHSVYPDENRPSLSN